jgi:2-oxoglutarate dehydrogenase E1 component
LTDFTAGAYKTVMAEVDDLDRARVTRIIVCSGKVYYDLLNARRVKGLNTMAIIRLEQLYPFPHADFAAQVALFPNATEMLWCQEEPGNQGAWHRIQHYLLRHMRQGMRLDYALRQSSAAPAAGYLAVHNEQQKAVIEAAFRPDLDVKNNPGAHHHESH